MKFYTGFIVNWPTSAACKLLARNITLKKIKILTLLALTAITTMTAAAAPRIEPPQGDPFTEPVKIRTTCYLDSGTTATGRPTRHGVIATKPEWMQEGYIFQIWEVNEDGSLGDFCGYYEPLDTGYGIELDASEGQSRIKEGQAIGSIEKGYSIDIFCENEAEVREWQAGGDYYYIKILTNCKG